MSEPQGERLENHLSHDKNWRSMLSGVARRETSALGAIYDASNTLVYSVALAILTNPADAEEITIDVYAYVWYSADSYDSARGTVTTWLIMLARSRAIERLRKRAATKDESDHQNHSLDSLSNDFVRGRTSLLERERSILVETALRQLPKKDQELIRLAFFSGYSHLELASKLNVPLGTLKSRIRAVLSHLRNIIME